MYAVYMCKDIKTGFTYVDTTARPIQRVQEDIEMYNRYNDGSMEFTVSEIGTYEDARKIYKYVDKKYKPNSFNAKLKNEPNDFITIGKDPSDPRDAPVMITLNNNKEESVWVNMILDLIATDLYNLSCRAVSNESYKIFGSMCHRGFVRSLFGDSDLIRVRKWINIIGDNYDENKFKDIKYGDNNYSIYEEGFSCSSVKKICKYCEMMFGMSRFEVAKFFNKKDPADFMNTGKDLLEIAYNTQKVAAIYAEQGNYEKAIEYYQLSVTMSEGKNWYERYQYKLDNFKKYYIKYGTSILSSVF